MTDEDLARIEATLRDAPWDLPLSDDFVTAAIEPRAPARRRAVPVWAAAAVVLVVAGAIGVRSSLSAGTGPAGGVTSAAPSAASPAKPATVSPAAGAARVTVGGWTFTAPAGFTPVGTLATSNRARFGPEGLLNDGEPLGPRDMAVTLQTRGLQSVDGGKLFVTSIVPEPTAAHPGPRPAADPRDVVAATRAIIDVESSIGGHADAARAVPGLPVGPATLVRFDDRNGILVARPAGSQAQVLLFEAGGAPVDLLVELARSAHR